MPDANNAANKPAEPTSSLAGELQRLEWDRKKSLEQRAITVITTSGTLVTLVFALTSVISKGQAFAKIIRAERIPLQISLWLFVGASVLALFANIPLLYRGISGRYVRNLKAGSATTSMLDAELNVLRSQRIQNSVKSWLLFLAILTEVAAVGFVAWTAYRILGKA